MHYHEILEFFTQFDSEYRKFDRIETPKSNRRDLCIFLILDEIFPDTKNIILGAEHNKIYLSVSPEKLIEKATTNQIRDLVRCGLIFENDGDFYLMFYV